MRLTTVLLAITLAALPAAAFAQAAPVPLGYWTTADNSEQLLIQAGPFCSFVATAGTNVGGSCGWNPSARGGILSIWYSTIGGPAQVQFNIVWINQTTISVWGDVFYRRQ